MPSDLFLRISSLVIGGFPPRSNTKQLPAQFVVPADESQSPAKLFGSGERVFFPRNWLFEPLRRHMRSYVRAILLNMSLTCNSPLCAGRDGLLAKSPFRRKIRVPRPLTCLLCRRSHIGDSFVKKRSSRFSWLAFPSVSDCAYRDRITLDKSQFSFVHSHALSDVLSSVRPGLSRHDQFFGTDSFLLEGSPFAAKLPHLFKVVFFSFGTFPCCGAKCLKLSRHFRRGQK